MFKIYIMLFIEFSKIGVFAIGGGYAVLPFLYYMQTEYNWFSIDELTNMIAVANITPGPIGINAATYTGFTTAGVVGALIATLSIVLIPFIITVFITKIFTKFENNKTVCYIFTGLKPAACALLCSIAIKLFYQSMFVEYTSLSDLTIDYYSLILFIILILPFSFMKKNPMLTILAGAIGGIIIKSL